MDYIDKLALLGLIFWIGIIMYSLTWGYEQELILTKSNDKQTVEDYIINE